MSNCGNPGVERKAVSHDSARAECTLTHCEAGFVVLDVKFEPRNLGNKVVLQGHFRYEGKKGSEAVTRRITFYDDGSVVGYGNLANGVRFRLMPWYRNANHTTILDAQFA